MNIEYKVGESNHPECPLGYVLAGFADKVSAQISFWKNKVIGKPVTSKREGTRYPLFAMKGEWMKLASSIKVSKPTPKTPINLVWIRNDKEEFCVDTTKPLRLIDVTQSVYKGIDFPRTTDVKLLRVSREEKKGEEVRTEVLLVLKDSYPAKVVGWPEEKWRTSHLKGEVYLHHASKS